MRCSLTRMPASAWPKRERSSAASSPYVTASAPSAKK
jgi:hypothetical protein